MKTITALVVLMLCGNGVYSQVNQWTWMKGDSVPEVLGNYGVQGMSAVANKPGARKLGITWRDVSGNLWLFGGEGWSGSGYGSLNDVWKYSLSTNRWTWVKGDTLEDQFGIYGTRGISTDTNHPGGRKGAISWVDSSGNFWMFGGNGQSEFSSGLLNDLWKYFPSINRWVWIKGDNAIDIKGVYGTKGISAGTNKPGSRENAVSWIDNAGNFWLFGGTGYDANGSYYLLDDLWKYNPSLNQWTWLKGDSLINQNGVYGIKGNSASDNKPGSRESAAGWKDANNNLWLFGGDGFGSSGLGYTALNDLWKYNPSNNQWTWMKGDTLGGSGVYGTRGISSSANKPGSKSGCESWNDRSGNFWLFGGWGADAESFVEGLLNDLWRYNPVSNQWTWMKGDTVINKYGVYGNKGISSTSTNPGSRQWSTSWADTSGNLWLFGGEGLATSNPYPATLNDLWKYTTNTCIPNIWTGSVNNALSNPANWSCNTLPASGANVTIPITANQPVLISNSTIGNLNLQGILNLNGQTLTINGTVTGTGTLTGSSTSNLIITGHAGTIKFTNGAAILHSLQIKMGAYAIVSNVFIAR